MKIKLTKLDICTSLLVLSSAIPGLIIYNKLPDRMAVHFGIDGMPDNFASKGFVILGWPILLFVLHLFCCIVSSLDKRLKKSPKPNFIVRFIVPYFAFILEIVTILYSLEKLNDIIKIVTLAVSLMMIVMGNYLPKCRQNSVIGIKIPQTLKSEEVWDKTHRFAGVLTVCLGIISMGFSLAGMYVLYVIVLPFICFVPIIYAVVISK